MIPQSLIPPHAPESSMSSPITTIIKLRKEANHYNMKIKVGYFVIEKVIEMEENTKKGGIRRMSK